MTSKFLLVFVLYIFSGFAISDTIPEKIDSPQFLLKSQKQYPSAEELKSSFQNSSKINLWGYFWKILFIFFLLVGVIFAISLFTSGNPIFSKNLTHNNHFKILHQQYLTSRQKILLVKSFEKYILLGVTDQSINKITEFEKHEIDEESLMNSQSQPFLSAFIKRGNEIG